MNFHEYQYEAVQTGVYPKDKAIEYLALGLVNEAGEVAGKIKKVIRGDKTLDEQTVAIIAEIGDVLWYVANLCEELGWQMEEVAFFNIQKLKDRQQRGVLKGDGDTR